MNKITVQIIWSLLLFCCCLFGFTQSYAKPSKALSLISTRAVIEGNELIVWNQSERSMSLQNSVLEFYSSQDILSAELTQPLKMPALLQKTDSSHRSNSLGNFYKIYLKYFTLTPPILMPGQSFHLKLITKPHSTQQFNSVPQIILHGIRFFSDELMPVDVKVTSDNAIAWVRTLSVCNISKDPIPLSSVQFEFYYDGKLSQAVGSIWGSPYLNWKVADQQGQHVILTGGNTWTAPLQPDPDCKHPLTIVFNTFPSTPLPSGPFVFKALGGHPVGSGTLNIALPSAPATGLNNVIVTIQGMGTSKTQQIAWGQQVKITSLIPGSYSITANAVDNSTEFFSAKPITVTIADKQTVTASIAYVTVPTSKINITIKNAPAGNQSITLTGKKYTFNTVITGKPTLILPQDSYTITANVPGYTMIATPNPLVVLSGTKELIINYQQAIPTASAHFAGYFQTWSSAWASDGTKTDLANLPSYINVVFLSFMRPDPTYVKGSFNYAGTGLEFNYSDGTVLKQAIATLHQKNPNTKVLVAVGGSSYTNWKAFNAQAIADFVTDFGLDGVDIDYEPLGPGCSVGSDHLVHCAIDDAFQSYVQSMRALLPHPHVVSIAAWSIGAYGQDQWVNAQPQGDYTGMTLPLLRSAAAKDLDMINVMSYDASNAYDPIMGLAAYSYYFHGPINMGVEVPPEAWGGHVYTVDEINRLTKQVIATATVNNTPPGMMLWSLQKQPSGAPSDTNPSPQIIAKNVCTLLGLNNCDTSLVAKKS